MTDPDLTAPEAVERRAKLLEQDEWPTVAATLRALSAQLLDVSKREAAMIARYDAKLEAAEAERDALKAELAEAVGVMQAWKTAGTDQVYYQAVQKRNAFLARHQKEKDT
jgi:hypothetical protein